MTEYTVDRNLVNDALEDAGVLDDPADVIYENYSGRGMYGTTCFGLVLGRGSRETAKFFVALGARDADLAYQLADALQTDSMGLETILYFPRYTLTEEE